MYTCRACERPINQATEVCPYCGTDLTEEALATEEEPRKKRNLVSVLLRWGVLLLAMWGFLWFVLPERGDPSARAEAEALELLNEARRGLAAYADAQGGSYPPSLEALPAESARAVREAAQRALADGYRMEYAAGPPGNDGRITTYFLRLRAGHYGYRSFFVDQSGVIRATRENRAATADDSPVQ